MNIKQWIKAWLDKLIGDAKAKIPMPDGKPTSKPTGKDTCTCNLLGATELPMVYTDEMLRNGGNAYICPTIGGRDIRLLLIKPYGGSWALGNLLPQAIVTSSPVICKCFDADNGRYHFVGYTYNNEKQDDIVKAKAGDVFEYKITTFVWYQYRRNTY